MGKTPLVGPDFDGGRELLEALERAGLPITFAGWLCLRETFDWQLFVASPDVQTHGPKSVIIFIDRIITATKSRISLSDITVVNTTNHFVNRIPEYYTPEKWPNAGVGPVRIHSISFDDGEIIEGFVYKIDRSVKPSKATPKPDASALKRARSLAA